MGKALYREYRPKKLSEVVGQDHVTTTLRNALKQGRISHAYLLTGPRGVGKTSIARILAHEINNLPYEDEAHLDIIEIDAASNRRIDEIRDLRDKVHTAPSTATYKVYIIDEVHMLTKEAFNALLKTLEEPPAHVVFILATTEAHKLPDTIISRTQRYTFRPVPLEQVVRHLRSIAQKEHIAIEDTALELLAAHGEGSFRDSISLLDQARSTGSTITEMDVARMLGLAPKEQVAALIGAIAAGDAGRIIGVLSELAEAGYEPAMIAVQLGAELRRQLLDGVLPATLSASMTLSLLEQLLDVPAARQPKQLLELRLLGVAMHTSAPLPSSPEPTNSQIPKISTPSTTPTPQSATVSRPRLNQTDDHSAAVSTVGPEPVAPAVKPADIASSPPSETAPAHATDSSSVSSLEGADVQALWQQVLDAIKREYNTLYGIARMAVPELKGDTLTLNLKFAFHQKRINEVKNRKILSDTFARLSGSPVDIRCVVADKPLPPKTEPAPGADLSAISNIFGGAEVLDS